MAYGTPKGTCKENPLLERKAQIAANVRYGNWTFEHPEATKEEQQKAKKGFLDAARKEVEVKEKA